MISKIIQMEIKFFALLMIAGVCFITLSCDDGGGRREVPRPCVTREELAKSGCVATDIFLSPGLCEPLECVSETMEFRLPPENAEDCDVPEACDFIRCNNARLVFTGLTINEEGNVEGTVIVNIDQFSEPFVCF